jgi:hypothetical protein
MLQLSPLVLEPSSAKVELYSEKLIRLKFPGKKVKVKLSL